MADPAQQGTTCEVCEGSGLELPHLRVDDPANGPCGACGGRGAVPQTIKAGLLEPATVDEPCGDRCSCADNGAEFPTECNRLTEAGKALPHVE